MIEYDNMCVYIMYRQRNTSCIAYCIKYPSLSLSIMRSHSHGHSHRKAIATYSLHSIEQSAGYMDISYRIYNIEYRVHNIDCHVYSIA